MLKAGIPLLLAFDIAGQGQGKPAMARLVNAIRRDVEAGASLATAFRRHPRQFDDLYCGLVGAGEAAGILDKLLDRLALHMEKTEAMKTKIKSALTYPLAVMAVAGMVLLVFMLFVVPIFRQAIASFGSELPGPTLLVIALSEFFVKYWFLIVGMTLGGVYFILRSIRSSEVWQARRDRLALKLPLFGNLIRKSCIARWTRTLATMLAAGVPLVDALASVGSASGNWVYREVSARMRQQVASGLALTTAMSRSQVFPPMVLQMCAIGEESGTLDFMLTKAADFFESEVDEAASGLASLVEPLIITFMGTIICGLLVALYLPIFNMGTVV
jgi:type IV pilus assembly protein PilC